MRSAGRIAKWKFNHQPKSPVFTFGNSPKVFVITGMNIEMVGDRFVQSVTYTQIPAVKIRGKIYDLREDDHPTLQREKGEVGSSIDSIISEAFQHGKLSKVY
jgi:hypothetical protein